MAALQELRNRVIEAFAQSRVASLDQGDLARQILLKEGPRVSRTVRNVAGNRGLSGGGENVIGDIAQERRVALRRFFECQRRNQAGLGASRDRRLGHHGDPAGRDCGLVDLSDGGSHDPSRAAPPVNLSSVGAAE